MLIVSHGLGFELKFATSEKFEFWSRKIVQEVRMPFGDFEAYNLGMGECMTCFDSSEHAWDVEKYTKILKDAQKKNDWPFSSPYHNHAYASISVAGNTAKGVVICIECGDVQTTVPGGSYHANEKKLSEIDDSILNFWTSYDFKNDDMCPCGRGVKYVYCHKQFVNTIDPINEDD